MILLLKLLANLRGRTEAIFTNLLQMHGAPVRRLISRSRIVHVCTAKKTQFVIGSFSGKLYWHRYNTALTIFPEIIMIVLGHSTTSVNSVPKVLRSVTSCSLSCSVLFYQGNRYLSLRIPCNSQER